MRSLSAELGLIKHNTHAREIIEMRELSHDMQPLLTAPFSALTSLAGGLATHSSQNKDGSAVHRANEPSVTIHVATNLGNSCNNADRSDLA